MDERMKYKYIAARVPRLNAAAAARISQLSEKQVTQLCDPGRHRRYMEAGGEPVGMRQAL